MGLHTVQFKGKKQVLQAFEETEVTNWSLWQGKQMITCYEGNDESEGRNKLETWLDLFQNGTDASYTLKFYRDFKEEILPSTKESSSWNFKLSSPDQLAPGGLGTIGEVYGAGGILGLVRELKTELEDIKKKVSAPVAPQEDKLETWEKILDHPVTMGLLGKVFNIDISQIEQVGKVSGVPGHTIDDSLDLLEKEDPKWEEHAYKLSMIAKNNKGLFATMVGALDKMNL
jgi:hypothetical protein